MEYQKYNRDDIYNMLGIMTKKQVESQKYYEERQKKYEERQKKSAKDFEELLKKSAKETAELKKSIKEVSQNIGGIGKNLGDITEDYFYSSISTTLNVNGIQYDSAEKNFQYKTKQKEAEYDIILINSIRILVVEVKHKLQQKHIEIFANKQLPLFKELFPEYKDYAIYGAVAGMSVPQESIETANKLGLYVFTQSQNSDNMIILNPKGFEPKRIS